jgi:tRNA-specific 2-thiouridylase
MRQVNLLYLDMVKVIVGMSGGVDSSVAAYLLREKGYDVEGLSFILWEKRRKADFGTCCSLQAVEEAAKTAKYIGIPHRIADVKNVFVENVIEPFVNAYAAGLTPNPCILCNRFIKFPLLIKDAEKRNAEFIATGHYARVEQSHKSLVDSHQLIPPTPPLAKGGEEGFESFTDYSLLKKGTDLKKDQSYVLYILNQEKLKKLVLPLGHYRKDEVREIAKDLKLPAAKRAASQEVCFVEDRNYFKFIEKLSPLAGKPGPIIDMTGKVIGTHKGIHAYTIGQRKRLGIAHKKPLYVVKIDVLKNAVYVGTQEDAKEREFYVEDLNWILPVPSENFKASVKVRSMMKGEPATIFLETSYDLRAAGTEQKKYTSHEVVRLVFDEPQWAPASGQSAVFYKDDVVIGGGIIRISS